MGSFRGGDYRFMLLKEGLSIAVQKVWQVMSHDRYGYIKAFSFVSSVVDMVAIALCGLAVIAFLVLIY